MVNEKVEGREMTWRTLFPWTELFRGFQVALDLNKLFLAAAGILVMAFGWWFLAVLFSTGYQTKPDYPQDYSQKAGGDVEKGWQQFKHDREQWNLMHQATNVGGDQTYEAQDLADSPAELERVRPYSRRPGQRGRTKWPRWISLRRIISKTKRRAFRRPEQKCIGRRSASPNPAAHSRRGRGPNTAGQIRFC